MNNKCTINPQLIIKCDFKHIFTYRMLYHIMVYYDTDSETIFIDRQDIAIRYNTNYKSVCNAINELIFKEVIIKKDNYKYIYKVNKRIFIEFVTGVSK